MKKEQIDALMNVIDKIISAMDHGHSADGFPVFTSRDRDRIGEAQLKLRKTLEKS